MPDTRDSYQCARAALKKAASEYAREASRMRQMLFELVSEPDHLRLPLIRAEQERLNWAGVRYRRAQDRYVRKVLGVAECTRELRHQNASNQE